MQGIAWPTQSQLQNGLDDGNNNPSGRMTREQFRTARANEFRTRRSVPVISLLNQSNANTFDPGMSVIDAGTGAVWRSTLDAFAASMIADLHAESCPTPSSVHYSGADVKQPSVTNERILDFSYTSLVESLTVHHFQLRHLLSAPSTRAIYYPCNHTSQQPM